MHYLLFILFILCSFSINAAPYLQKGDIIDIVAPSYGCTLEELQKIKTQIKQMGYTPRISEDILNPTYLSYSNSNDYRLRDLKRALTAPDSKIIWVIRGGYGAQELLESLNELEIPTHKKLLIGFSDTTYLHLFLNQIWDWPSLNAPALKFNKEINQKVNGGTSLTEITNFLENPNFSYSLTPMNKAAKESLTIKGKMIGSNMTILAVSMGNFYAPQLKDKIILLEDLGEDPQKVRRNFLALKELDRAKAIIFGDFTLTNTKLTERVLQDFADQIDVPCYKTNLFGHGKINQPFLLNTSVEIEKNILKN